MCVVDIVESMLMFSMTAAGCDVGRLVLLIRDGVVGWMDYCGVLRARSQGVVLVCACGRQRVFLCRPSAITDWSISRRLAAELRGVALQLLLGAARCQAKSVCTPLPDRNSCKTPHNQLACAMMPTTTTQERAQCSRATATTPHTQNGRRSTLGGGHVGGHVQGPEQGPGRGRAKRGCVLVT